MHSNVASGCLPELSASADKMIAIAKPLRAAIGEISGAEVLRRCAVWAWPKGMRQWV
jgi:hypothetical protein